MDWKLGQCVANRILLTWEVGASCKGCELILGAWVIGNFMIKQGKPLVESGIFVGLEVG